MSLHSQIALGKNQSLQRQLDGKFVEYKKSLRSSRRRLDSLEEECVSSLYKLLLEAKANKMAGEPVNRRSITPDTADGRSKSAIVRPQSVVNIPRKDNSNLPERPFTSMSSRNYTQSYSFKKDGLDISKYSRGRSNQKKKAVGEKRPISVVGLRPFSENDPEIDGTLTLNGNGNAQRRAFEIRRSQSAHTFRTDQTTFRENIGQSESVVQMNETSNDFPDGAIAENYNNDTAEKTRPTSILKHRTGAPVVVKVHESNTQLDEFRPLSVTITRTTPLEHPIYNVQATHTSTPYTRTNTPFEEELLPLMGEDDNTKPERTTEDVGTDRKINKTSNRKNLVITPYSRNMAPSRSESEDSALLKAKSIHEHQKFLSEYSKRSKLFGYVVKTKAASIFNEKSRRTSRSPCVTYQELVSIKSSMKQQETRTRMLLKRSAKLSSYVDQLAMASQYRQHLQALKDGKTTRDLGSC